MASRQLRIIGVEIRLPDHSQPTSAGVPAWMELIVEVENTGTRNLHVWASHRGYEYDPASRLLTLHLAERPLVVPQNVIVISQHPRAPDQIEVGGKSRVKIRLRVPPFIRRRAQDGRGWIEDPIGTVDHVDVRVQYALQPFDKPAEHETENEYRARAQTHGNVVQERITPDL